MSPPAPLTLRTVVLAVALAAAGFAVNYWIELQLFRLGVFGQFNVLFETDPNVYLANIGHGWGVFLFQHANVISFFNPPVRATAMLVSLVSQAPATEVRESIALLVIPTLNAAKTLFLFALFRRLGLPILATALLCVLDIASFSRLVFGSLPESFPASAAIMAAAAWFAMSPRPGEPRVRLAVWIVLVTFAMGVTITNGVMLMPFLVLDANRRATPAIGRTLMRVVVVLVAAAVLHVAIAQLMSRGYRADAFILSYDPRDDVHIKNTPLAAARQLSWIVPNTLLAPQPIVVPNSIKDPAVKFPYMFSYTYPGALPAAQVVTAALAYLMLAAGVIGMARARELRPLLLASAAIVVMNLVMHLAFGYEYFLYTQHWQVPLLILVGGILWTGTPTRSRTGTLGPGFRMRAPMVALAAFTALVAITSTSHVLWMLAVLRLG